METGLKKYFGGFKSLACLLAAVGLFSTSLISQTVVVESGDDFTAVIDASGDLYTFGSNASGQLGVADAGAFSSIIQQVAPSGVWLDVAVSRSAETGGGATGGGHVLAIQTDGSVWAWGDNSSYQLGLGDTDNRSTPTLVIGGGIPFTAVAAGTDFSMALRSDGRVYVWGSNTHGQMARTIFAKVLGTGLGDPADSRNFVQVPDLLDTNTYLSIAAGLRSALAVRSSGALFSWGYTLTLQHGQSATVPAATLVGPIINPVRVGSSNAWTQVFMGNTLAFALRSGSLYAWGADGHTGLRGLAYTPTHVPTGSLGNFHNDWESVSIGHTHTLGIRGGLLYGWGDNETGALGLPLQDENGAYLTNNYYKHYPVPLLADRTFQAVGAGLDFSAIYTSDAFLLTAGINSVGQLGNGLLLSSGQYEFLPSSLGAIDLVAESLSVTTVDPVSGGNLNATLFLRNDGTGPINDAFTLGAVLSPSTNYGNPAAIPLPFVSGETVNTPIANGESISQAITLQLPISVPAGDYFLVVRADAATPRVLEELTTDNNDVASNDVGGEPFTIQFNPDLEVLGPAITVDPDPDSLGNTFPLTSGDPIEVTVTITNQGGGSMPSGPLGQFVQRFVLGSVADINAPGIVAFVPEDTTTLTETGGLVGGGTLVRTYRFVLPDTIGAGEFFLGIEVDIDDAIGESNEANNIAFTSTPLIQIAGIDLAEALDNLNLDFVLDGDGSWFGSDSVDLIGAAVAGGASPDPDAAVSPSLTVGQEAIVEFTPDEASLVTFRWRSATSSPQNKLRFNLLGAEASSGVNEISGTTDWQIVTKVVPGNVQVQWIYSQGAEGVGDVVFLDDIQVAPITGPDFVVDSATLSNPPEGGYILGRDALTITTQVRNQGLNHLASDPDFDVRVYLSSNAAFDPADDILIRTATNTTNLLSGATSVLFPSTQLPTTIAEGNYYLIVVVDEENAVDYEVDDVALPGGTGADVQLNNIFISETASIEIVRLPDLRVASINPNPGFYLIGESLDFSIDLQNTGLQSISDPIAVRIVLSLDNEFSGDDAVLGEFSFGGGLSASGAIRTFSPDVADIPPNMPIGEFRYFIVVIDPDNAITELNDGNNQAIFPNPHFIFAEVPMDEAVELDEVGLLVTNNESVPFAGAKPFVGQTSVTFDGVDAAQSSLIFDNETAAFETVITTGTSTVLSFRWKVSSEFVVLSGGSIKEDTLKVFINGVERGKISGEVDWSEVNIPIEAGTNTIRFAYTKDISDAAGQDRGWVDQINFRLPDLIVSNLNVPVQSVAPGEIIQFSFNIENIGLDSVAATPVYGVEVRLSPDPVWGNDGDVLLNLTPAPVNSGELASGGSQNFNVSTELPASFADVDTYYLAVRVDPDAGSSNSPTNGSGIIAETDDTNNTTFTVQPRITVTPALSLSEAIDDSDFDDPDPTVLSLVIGGAGTWFGLGDLESNDLPLGTLLNPDDGNNSERSDVARSSPIQQNEAAYFETRVTGPKVLKFRWKVDSRPGANFLELSMNGEVQESLSGRVDWDFGYGSFTITYNGETTASIRGGAEPAVVETALNTLASISVAGGVTVTAPDALSYVVTFNDNGNRPIMGFTSLDATRVSSGVFSTASGLGGQNGSTLQPEIQVLQITPNVYFTLGYRGDTTVNLSYLAKAIDVDAALNALSTISADGGVTVTDHPLAESALDFIITFDDPGLRDLITVNATGLKQPVTVEAELTSDRLKNGLASSQGQAGDLLTVQVQPLRIGPEITLFVPASAGEQTLRWTYRKTSDAGPYEDSGWVDAIRFIDFDSPELELTALNYVAGEYVLDVGAIAGAPQQKLGTEILDVSVEAKNLGAQLDPSVGAFTTADLEVRLSVDQVFGNGDDILLGNFNQVEGSFGSGGLLRFIGGIDLGDDIPAGFYYLMAKVDSNQRIDEFTKANNIVISANRDVQITRLPRLQPVDGRNGSETETAFYHNFADFDEVVTYYPRAPMRVKVDIQNIGLGSVLDGLSGDASDWNTRVNLVGIKRVDLTNAVGDFEDAIAFVYDTGDFDVNVFDEPQLGRRDGVPDGDVLPFDIELTLPTILQLLAVIEQGTTIEDYVYFLQLVVDSDNTVRESAIRNIWNSVDVAGLDLVNAPTALEPLDELGPPLLADGLFTIRPVGFTTVPLTEGDYASAFGVTGGAVDSDGDGMSDQLEYAFGRNPAVSDGVGVGFPGSFGIDEVGGEQRLSVTFDFQRFSGDVTYRVQVTDNLLDPWSDLVVLDGPFFDLVGAASLNGDGGLIENPLVLGIVEAGSTARITVIDSAVVGESTSRFMRIQLDGLETVPVP